jgi:hypothetical protein
MSYLKKDGKKYWVIGPECIGRTCLALGTFHHRGAIGAAGSRNTGSVSLCCLRNAYHGCPSEKPFDKFLAALRRKEGIRYLT